jgi:signal transduction histidine kinase/ActR/RegA family two-component response regulator
MVKRTGKNEENNKKVRRKNGTWLCVCGLVLLIAAAMVVATVYFYHSLEEQLFAERQSHLIEMTQKISEVINTTIESVQSKASSAKELLEQAGTMDEEELMKELENTAALLEIRDGVVLAMDSQGMYYSSEGTSGHWEQLEDLVTEHVMPQVRELTVYGTKQACMVFFRQLDEAKSFGTGANTLTHVAVAIPMDTMEGTLSMTIFDDACFTYLVNSSGRRLYRQTLGDSFIEDVNVLSGMGKETFVMGGGLEDLVQAVEGRKPLCLEFKETGRGENYFVSTVPVNNSEWTVLLFVPTRVIGAYTNSVLSLVVKYFVGIGSAFGLICGGLIFAIITAKNDRRMMLQQEQNNRLLEQAAQEAKSANAAKSAFLSHMSHDIRTPINGIIGMTNIAIKNFEDPDRVADCLNKINGAAEHLLMLVNDVLDMSRIESGNVVIAHDHMDMRVLIENCVQIICGQMSSRKLELVQEIEAFQHPHLLGDELHLRQVIINILGNAVKFTPEGGRITFKAQELPDVDGRAIYRFEFTDTGIGMSEQFQKRIFEEFSQEENGSRTNYNGTGLGMAITKQFVDMMGGTISVQSRQGEGSCFIVELAFEIDPEEQLESACSAHVSVKGMKVLLVEDNALNMEIAKEILQEEGVEITPAEDGRQAVELFTGAPEGRFDAILMDVMMPVMNGYEATKAIRASQHPEAKTIPIIAMTANAYIEDVQAALDAGMNAHVAKPIDFKVLFSTLGCYRKEQ